jgi:hypothetical protein
VSGFLRPSLLPFLSRSRLLLIGLLKRSRSTLVLALVVPGSNLSSYIDCVDWRFVLVPSGQMSGERERPLLGGGPVLGICRTAGVPAESGSKYLSDVILEECQYSRRFVQGTSFRRLYCLQR